MSPRFLHVVTNGRMRLFLNDTAILAPYIQRISDLYMSDLCRFFSEFSVCLLSLFLGLSDRMFKFFIAKSINLFLSFLFLKSPSERDKCLPIFFLHSIILRFVFCMFDFFVLPGVFLGEWHKMCLSLCELELLVLTG